MRYLLRSGILYKGEEERGAALAEIKSRLCGSEKVVMVGDQSFNAMIQRSMSPGADVGAYSEQYLLNDSFGETVLSGIPKFTKNQNPVVAGWPVCRLPRVDTVTLQGKGESTYLKMLSNQRYQLMDEANQVLLSIVHRGVIGGWMIETDREYPAQLICGMFIFCRYMEQANELLVV